MARTKGLGVNPITNTIYYGTQDTEKHMWVGNKTDVTDSAIAAVFEWLIGNFDDSMEEFTITYPNSEYEMVIRRKVE
jgi:hypothetical protein